MPNSVNAEKRHRQNLKRRLRNRSAKSSIRTSLKAFEAAVDSKDKSQAEIKFNEYVKLLDSATRKGVFHQNTAARKKSRMHKMLNSL